MKIVIYGLTITSSWGNGHATTYRSLSGPWPAEATQSTSSKRMWSGTATTAILPQPDFCTVHLYEDWAATSRELIALASDADVIVVGSYFPDAIAASRAAVQCRVRPCVVL